MTVEYVEQGGREPGLPRPALGVLVVVVLLLAVVGWQLDARARARETAALAECRAAVETSLERARGYVRFMGGYVSPALTSSPPDHVREGLIRLLQDSAERGRGGVRSAAELCEQVRVWPTHEKLRTARTAYLDYVRTELAWLDLVVTDGRWAYRSSATTETMRDRIAEADRLLGQ